MPVPYIHNLLAIVVLFSSFFSPRAAALHEDDAVGGPDGSVKSGRSGRSRGGSSKRYASGQDDIELPLPPG